LSSLSRLRLNQSILFLIDRLKEAVPNSFPPINGIPPLEVSPIIPQDYSTMGYVPGYSMYGNPYVNMPMNNYMPYYQYQCIIL